MWCEGTCCWCQRRSEWPQKNATPSPKPEPRLQIMIRRHEARRWSEPPATLLVEFRFPVILGPVQRVPTYCSSQWSDSTPVGLSLDVFLTLLPSEKKKHRRWSSGDLPPRKLPPTSTKINSYAPDPEKKEKRKYGKTFNAIETVPKYFLPETSFMIRSYA